MRKAILSFLLVLIASLTCGVFTACFDDVDTGKIELDAPVIKSQVYNGSAQTATIPKHDGYDVTVNDGGTDVGEYDVVLVLKNADKYAWKTPDADDATKVTLKFAITKADNEISSLTLEGWSSGETANTPTVVALFGAETATFTYSSEENGTYVTDVPTEAGNYYVKATIADTANYFGAEKVAEFTIAKQANEISSLTLEGWTFGENANTPTVVALFGGSTAVFTYSTEENGMYVTEVPVNAGTYYVKATIAETVDYARAEKIARFVIAQATNNITSLTLDGWTFGETAKTPAVTALFGAETVSFTYSVEENGTYVSDVPVNAGAYHVKATIVETNNYTAAEKTVRFVIAKAANEITALTITGWTYGEKANTPVITALYGEENVVYTYSTEESGTYTENVPENAGKYYVKAMIAESDNYTAIEKTEQFTIAQATNVVTMSEDILTLGCGEQLPDFGATAKFGKVVYTYSKDSETFVSEAEFGSLVVGIYFVKASVPSTPNYSAAEQVKSFNVVHDFGDATVVDGISTRLCACGAKQVTGDIAHSDITLNVAVTESVAAATTGEVDLTAVYNGSAKATVMIGEEKYENVVVANGVISLAGFVPAELCGKQSVRVKIRDGEDFYDLTVSAFFITKSVATEADIQSISTIETALGGKGYYLLTADITMTNETAWYTSDSVNFVIGWNHTFTGTINGNGHKITGFAIKHWDNFIGFIRNFGDGGELKNIAFVDAIFMHRGGLITVASKTDKGVSLENVYIGVKMFDNKDQKNHGLFGPAYDYYTLNMKNVIVDYSKAVISNVEKDDTTLFGSFSVYSKFENVAVIGMPRPYKGTAYEGKNLTTDDGTYKMYISYSDNTTNGVAVPDSGWDESCWTMEEGELPIFKGIYRQKSITVNDIVANLNVSVDGGVATSDNVTIDLGLNLGNVTLQGLTIDGESHSGWSFDGSKLYIYELSATSHGNKTVTLAARSATTEYTITINALFVTKLIATEADLQSISAIETALGGDGYYQLAADITMSAHGWYWPYGDAAVNYIIGLGHSFIGTIDGNGYKIIGLTLSEMYDVTTTSGFISQFGAGGVLKNIAFIDASFKHKAGLIQGGSSGSTGGVIENVYIGIKSYDSANQNGYGLFGPSYNNYTFTMKNLIVDYTGATISNIEGRTNVNLFGSFGYYTTFSNVAVIGVPTELSSYVGNIRAEWKDKVYIGYADGTTNGVTIPDSGWNETYWTMTAGSLPTFKSKEN